MIDSTDEQQMNECIDEQIDNEQIEHEQIEHEQIEDFEVEESDVDESSHEMAGTEFLSAKSIKWFYCSMGDESLCDASEALESFIFILQK